MGLNWITLLPVWTRLYGKILLHTALKWKELVIAVNGLILNKSGHTEHNHLPNNLLYLISTDIKHMMIVISVTKCCKKEANFCKSGPKSSQKQFLLKAILPKKLPNILATFLTKNCLQNISKIAQSGALDCDRLTHKLTWMKIFDWLWMRCPDTSGVS